MSHTNYGEILSFMVLVHEINFVMVFKVILLVDWLSEYIGIDEEQESESFHQGKIFVHAIEISHDVVELLGELLDQIRIRLLVYILQNRFVCINNQFLLSTSLRLR
jgi:hypothetical protein